MSIKATSWAWEQRGLDPTAKLILMHLADAHNAQTGRCNPSIGRIAESCEVSVRTVQRQVATLGARGYIIITSSVGRGGQRSNNYELQLDKMSPRSEPVTHDQKPVTDDAELVTRDQKQVTGVTPIEPEETVSEPESEREARARDMLQDETPTIGTDEDHWRMSIGAQGWARSLKRAGCKIGPKNWVQWHGMVDEHGQEVVITAARQVPAPKRWPDEVEAKLARNGTVPQDEGMVF